MFVKQRLEIIMEMLQEHKSVTISDICDRLEISQLTARRDLAVLQEQNLIHRVYGGAMLAESEDNTFNPNNLDAEESERFLQAIAQEAASTVREGDVIFMGPGATVQAMAQYLRLIPKLTVITCSPDVLVALANSEVSIYITGGKLVDNANRSTISSPQAIEYLKSFCADKAYISCSGVSLKHGVSDRSTSSAELCRIMVENADHTYLVSNSDKFGKNSLSTVCPLKSIHTIITDSSLKKEIVQDISKLGVQLDLVDTSTASKLQSE